MIEMTSSQLAKEADRLSNDQVLGEAISRARATALDGLSTVDANDPVAVVRLQQRVKALDDIRRELGSMVLAVPVSKPAPY